MTARTFGALCLVITGLLALAPGSHAQPHKNKVHKPTPAAKTGSSPASGWRPNAALLKQLAPDVPLGDYGIRPPQGYEFSVDTNEADKGMVSSSHWAGEKRADGSQADIYVFIVSPKPGFHPADVEKQMAGFQKAIQGNLHGLTQSPTENGTVHGLSFSRLYWKGTDTDSKTNQVQHVHGLTYTAVDNYTIIVVAASDTEPYSQTTLPLMEAAVETLHPEQ